jgi:hypothetical protein
MRRGERDSPRYRLARVLKHAYSGELAAAHAYRGHARSLRSDVERQEVERIEAEELEHRRRIGEMLAEMGEPVDRWRELRMLCIGFAIGIACRAGGWFIPMYGAGKLESKNVGEYEAAARYARLAGFGHWVEDLLRMAEVESDHEAYFHQKCEGHRWFRFFPKWQRPHDIFAIRSAFAGDAPTGE